MSNRTMSNINFVPADLAIHRNTLLKLNVEYMQWNSEQLLAMFGIRFKDVAGAEVPEYVASHIDKACGEPPPNGCFYLVEYNGEVAGMGGLRRIHGDISELKRVYVRPAFRGKNIGAAILQRVLVDAKAFGFKSMRLDTGPFMHAAHRLYLSNGFVDRAPYIEAEVGEALHDRWRFMEREI